MKCPFCQHTDTQVLETRVSEEGDSIRRRRRCSACDKRFTTFERVELALPVIIKKNGSRTEYVADKVRGSLKLALRKRPVSIEAIDASVRKIEEELRSRGAREVESAYLGELVMKALLGIDKIAYIRFASVYRNFDDPAEFQDMIEQLGKPVVASDK